MIDRHKSNQDLLVAGARVLGNFGNFGKNVESSKVSIG